MAARMEWESDEQYRERLRFIDWFKKRYRKEAQDENQLTSMAQCYSNVRFFQSVYADEIMKVIAEFKRECVSPAASQRGSIARPQTQSQHVYASGPQPRSHSADGAQRARPNPPQPPQKARVEAEHTYVYVPPQSRGVYADYNYRYDRSDASYYVQQRRVESPAYAPHTRQHSEHRYRQDFSPPPVPPASQPPHTYHYQPPTYFDYSTSPSHGRSVRAQPPPVNRRW